MPDKSHMARFEQIVLYKGVSFREHKHELILPNSMRLNLLFDFFFSTVDIGNLQAKNMMDIIIKLTLRLFVFM